MHRSESWRKNHLLDSHLTRGLESLERDGSSATAAPIVEGVDGVERQLPPPPEGLAALRELLGLWPSSSAVSALDVAHVMEVEQKVGMQPQLERQ